MMKIVWLLAAVLLSLATPSSAEDICSLGITCLSDDQDASGEVDQPSVPAEVTCTWSSTPNGFKQTCGPAYVEPTGCDAGFTKVCVRRYGVRTCDCYPE